MNEATESTQEAAPKPNWTTAWRAAGIVLLVFLGLLTVLGSLTAPFSPYDDLVYINPTKVGLPDYGWFAPFFSKPYHSIYMPLAQLSYKLNLTFIGEDAVWSFRLINALLHAGSGIFLLGLMRELGLRPRQALFLAAAWTAHPIACECVSWASQRHTVMAMFFGIGGLYAYVRWHAAWKGILLGSLGLLLALLSKPAALSFLPIFLALEILGGPERLSKTPEDWEETRSTLPNHAGLGVRLVPLLLFAAVFTAIGILGAGIRMVPPPGGHWYTALMTDTEIFVRYAANICVPTELSAFYGVEDIKALDDPRVYFNSAILVATMAITVCIARSRRRAVFGWLWFFGALGPNANLVGITFTMQDRYVYIASVGLLLVLVEFVFGLAERPRRRTATEKRDPPPVGVLTILGSAFVIFLCVLTYQRGALWGDTLALFKQATERQPASGLARIQYGLMLAKEAAANRADPGPGSNEQAFNNSYSAMRHLKVALEECPDTYRYFDPLRVHVTLANEATRVGQTDTAREALERFLPPETVKDEESVLTEEHRQFGFGVLSHNGYRYFYKKGTLADAYLSAARAELVDARTHLKRAPEKTRAHAARALMLAQQALRTWPRNTESFIVQGRAHIQLHRHAHGIGDHASAWRHYRLARKAFESVPAFAPCSAAAETTLKALKAPEYPDPSAE